MGDEATPSGNPDEPPRSPDQTDPATDPGWEEPDTGPGITGPRGLGPGGVTLPSKMGSRSLAGAARTAHHERRKTRVGLVVSDKMDKTVVVEVEDRVKHALYGKVMRRTSRVKAHDELNESGAGDQVLIMETRPLSATKRWRLVKIIDKAK